MNNFKTCYFCFFFAIAKPDSLTHPGYGTTRRTATQTNEKMNLESSSRMAKLQQSATSPVRGEYASDPESAGTGRRARRLGLSASYARLPRRLRASRGSSKDDSAVVVRRRHATQVREDRKHDAWRQQVPLWPLCQWWGDFWRLPPN